MLPSGEARSGIMSVSNKHGIYFNESDSKSKHEQFHDENNLISHERPIDKHHFPSEMTEE